MTETVVSKIFKSTITFLEPHRVTGFIKAADVEDARTQLTEAAEKEGLVSFGIENLEEVDTSKVVYPEPTVIPLEEDEDTPVQTPGTAKPTLN